MFVVALEGTDSVGKTSVCQELGRMGYTTRRQPGTPQMREFIKTELMGEDVPHDLLALAMALDRRLDEWQNPIEDFIVFDRSIISSLVMNVDETWESLVYALGINMYATLPNIVIWLRASEDILRVRLRNDGDATDMCAIETQELYQERIPKLKRLFPSILFHEIFVDDKPIDALAQEVDRFLQPYVFFYESGKRLPHPADQAALRSTVRRHWWDFFKGRASGN